MDFLDGLIRWICQVDLFVARPVCPALPRWRQGHCKALPPAVERAKAARQTPRARGGERMAGKSAYHWKSEKSSKIGPFQFKQKRPAGNRTHRPHFFFYSYFLFQRLFSGAPPEVCFKDASFKIRSFGANLSVLIFQHRSFRTRHSRRFSVSISKSFSLFV